MSAPKKPFLLQGKCEVKPACAVRWAWHMLYACNYRCPHCVFAPDWERLDGRTVYLSVPEWLRHWARIRERYGRGDIVITGGEPFLYPDFGALVAGLVRIHWPINISTNSSGDLRDLVKRVDHPNRVSFGVSFQPGGDGLEAVMERARYLKEHGFRVDYINFAAYPPYLAKLDEYLELAAARGVTLKVIPFYGTFQGARYPDGYTAEERRRLGLDAAWEKNVRRFGRLCPAGQRSALIFPNGKVARCGQVGERLIIGDFLSDDFRLWDSPRPCDAELCPCMESYAAEPG